MPPTRPGQIPPRGALQNSTAAARVRGERLSPRRSAEGDDTAQPAGIVSLSSNTVRQISDMTNYFHVQQAENRAATVAPAVREWQPRISRFWLNFEAQVFNHGVRIFLSELIGTFTLAVIGSQGGIVLRDNKVVIATTWAAGVFFGQIFSDAFSGAHLNPAVTITLALQRGYSKRMVPWVIIAQILGAFAGFAFNIGFSQNKFNDAKAECGSQCALEMVASFPDPTDWNIVLLEGFWSTMVGFTIAFATNKLQKYERFQRYLVITAAVWVAILCCPLPLSLNPACEIGRRSAASCFYGKKVWQTNYAAVASIGPIVGMNIGFLWHDLFWTDRQAMVNEEFARIQLSRGWFQKLTWLQKLRGDQERGEQ